MNTLSKTEDYANEESILLICTLSVLLTLSTPVLVAAGDCIYSWEHYFSDDRDSNGNKIIDHYDENYHYVRQTCTYCNKTRLNPEKHDIDWDIIRRATPVKKGVDWHGCSHCDYSKYSHYKWHYVSWLGDTDEYKCYDIKDHSTIYKDSRTIKVKLYNALKGSEVRVKIGNQTYKKKLKNTNKSVTVNINPSQYGSKFSVNVCYKGRLIGKDRSFSWNVVRYASKPQIGMSKEQIKYTWGSPSRTGSTSGGYEFWYYDSGSSVTFRNGYVNSWYSAR